MNVTIRLSLVLWSVALLSPSVLAQTMVQRGLFRQPARVVDGQTLSDSIRRDSITRTWIELDANTQTALSKATALVAEQMRSYDRKQRGIR